MHRFLTFLCAFLLTAAVATGQGTTNTTSPNTLMPDYKVNVVAASATGANINLAAVTPGTTAVDGVTLTANARFLAKDQTNPAQNGIYTAPATAGAAVRAVDANMWSELPGAQVTAAGGATNAGKIFVCTAAATGTLGTDPVPWVAAGGGGGSSAGGSGSAVQTFPFSVFTLKQTVPNIAGLVGTGISGVSYNNRTATLFLVRNASGGPAEIYEASMDGRVLRTIVEQTGWEDTEVVEWVGWDETNKCDVLLVGEEDVGGAAGTNDARLSLCRLLPGATTLTRAGTGNVSTLTVYSGGTMNNLGLEAACYDSSRSVVYYTCEKQTTAGSDNTAGSANAKIFQRPITWSGGTYSFGAESMLVNINALFPATLTDISDMTYDRQTDTIILISDESDKCVRLSLATATLGNVLETLATPGNQPEGVAISSDGRTLWCVGEAAEFYRYGSAIDPVGPVPYFPDGTAAAPGIAFASQTAVGFRPAGANGMYFGAAGSDRGYLNTNGVNLPAAGLFAWSSTSNPGLASDTVIQRPTARLVQLGNVASATPGNYTIQIGESTRGGTDTNLPGGSAGIRPGAGTGNSMPTFLSFDTPTVTGSGTTQQTYTTRLTINATAAAFNVPLVASMIHLNTGTVTYAATTNLDFNLSSLATVSLTGNVIFTTSNLSSGRSMTLRIIADATPRNLTFPAGWVFLGAAAPSSIAASKTGVLTLTAFGGADANVVASYAAQP